MSSPRPRYSALQGFRKILMRQVPAGKWFAWLAMAACLAGAGRLAWDWFQYEPPVIHESDRMLVRHLHETGWLPGQPALVADPDPVAGAQPSPWGIEHASIYLGDVEKRSWPYPESAAMFREFALLHELAHARLDATRPSPSDPQLEPFAKMVHAFPDRFWVHVVDETHSDLWAALAMLDRHGPGPTASLLRQVVQWRQGHALFEAFDPHGKIDTLSRWIDEMAPGGMLDRRFSPQQAATLAFDAALADAVHWLAQHPQEQSDLFHGTMHRPVLVRVKDEEVTMAWIAQSRNRPQAVRLPRNASPSQRGVANGGGQNRHADWILQDAAWRAQTAKAAEAALARMK